MWAIPSSAGQIVPPTGWLAGLFEAARDVGAVADLNDAGNPAVLALIVRTVEAARKRSVEVSLCGDAAADTRLTTALLATGLTSLSVAPVAVARLKAAIAKVGS